MTLLAAGLSVAGLMLTSLFAYRIGLDRGQARVRAAALAHGTNHRVRCGVQQFLDDDIACREAVGLR